MPKSKLPFVIIWLLIQNLNGFVLNEPGLNYDDDEPFLDWLLDNEEYDTSEGNSTERIEKKSVPKLDDESVKMAADSFFKYHQLLKYQKFLSVPKRKLAIMSYLTLHNLLQDYVRGNPANEKKLNRVIANILASQKTKIKHD